MSQTHFRTETQTRSSRRSYAVARVLPMATVAGLVLGPADLLAQVTLPYPWANLANSGAVWALAAFVLGTQVRPAAMSAVAGLVLLAVAVESYYLAGVVFRHDSTATLSDRVAVLWLALAVVVGPFFGLAGGAVRSTRRTVRFVAAGCAGLIFLLEAGALLRRSDLGGGSNHQTAVIEIVLAILVPLVTLAVTRPRR